MLELEDVDAYYGKSQALHNLSLKVETGQLVSLIGRNGAGKTTTMRSIMGLVSVGSGRIMYKNNNLAEDSPHEIARRGITYIPEERRVFSNQTVRENLLLGHIGSGRSETLQSKLEGVYRYFPVLAERENQRAGSLSGGEQQMVAIGRGLVSDPDLILIDEPTEGLMPALVTSLRDNIAEINASGKAILLVEQNTQLTLGLSDYIYVIENGLIRLEGSSDELDRDEIEQFLHVR